MSVSKCLGHIFNSTSGKGNDYKTDENLDSKIVKFFIGWSNLEFTKNVSALSFFGGSLSDFFLPSFLGGGRYFQHGFCWFELENGYSYMIHQDII